MNKEEIVLTCDCGCGSGLVFSKFDDFIYVSPFEALFYSNQRATLTELKKYKKYLFGDHCLFDIIVTKDELLKLKKFIESCNLVPIDKPLPKYYGGSSIEIEQTYDLYTITINGYMIKKDAVLFRKLYKMYDIIYDEHRIKYLLDEINKVLK